MRGRGPCRHRHARCGEACRRPRPDWRRTARPRAHHRCAARWSGGAAGWSPARPPRRASTRPPRRDRSAARGAARAAGSTPPGGGARRRVRPRARPPGGPWRRSPRTGSARRLRPPHRRGSPRDRGPPRRSTPGRCSPLSTSRSIQPTSTRPARKSGWPTICWRKARLVVPPV